MMGLNLKQRDLALCATGGFVAWMVVADLFPVIRYVCYSFLIGCCCAPLALAVSGLLSVRDVRPRVKHSGPYSLAGTNLAFLASPESFEKNADRLRKAAQYKPRSLYASSFVVSEAIDEILGFALRDFITSWYQHISSNPAFCKEIDRAIRGAILQARAHAIKYDLVEILVSRVVPIITQHLKDFDVAERSVRGKNLSRTVTETEELDLAIAQRFRDGNLHPAACGSTGLVSATAAATAPSFASGVSQAQQDHVHRIVTMLLPMLFPKEQLQSQVVAVLLREILSCSVLLPLVCLLRDPDTWNRLIEAYGRTALQDRKTVRKLRAALDQHAAPLPTSSSSRTRRDGHNGQAPSLPQLTVHASERDFERFVRAIRRCNNLSDLRKFRNHVASQLKRESTVEGQDSVYLRRLETSKRVLDQKVARLSILGARGTSGSNGTRNGDGRMVARRVPSSTTINASSSLVDIMHNASSLSHFMEYMDRINKMTLVQFWIVVDGFRNPLEDDFGDESAKVKWTTADWNDIMLINETYLSKPELHVSLESRQAVAHFIQAGRKATLEQYRKARTAILSAQSAVLEVMQTEYFPGFKSSDLYFKCLALDEAAAVTAASATSTSARPPVHTSKSPRPISPRQGGRRKLATVLPDLDDNTSLPPRPSSDTRSETATLARSPNRGPPRLSLDSERRPLFEDDLDGGDLLLFSSANAEPDTAVAAKEGYDQESASRQTQVLESMEAALNDIIAGEPRLEQTDDLGDSLVRIKSASSSTSAVQPTHDKHEKDKAKPSIASLGLVNPVGRIGVFTDNDLFPDEEKFLEDEYADPISDSDEDNLLKDIHPAAPGDLGLAEAITALNEDIEKLVAQEYVVDALTKKAELTNNAAELRILGKSKASLQREIRRKEMQRQQYIIQEGDAGLYRRSTVQIKSIMIGKEDEKREFASYLVEVRRMAADNQGVTASWVVPRRYSEFHELHQQLRAQYPAVRNLEFPRRRVVMKLQKDFLQKRRLALEAYLQQLLELPEVCRSRELRSFLSQRTIAGSPNHGAASENDSKDLVSRIYSSVADGMDDFLGNIAVLDQLTVAGQSLISHLSNNPVPSSLADTAARLPTDEDAVSAAEAEAELNAFENRELEPFVKPICDIFLELFSLNRGNSWFRGRAVVVVLHQLLGGTVERKVRDSINSLFSESSVLRLVGMVKDTFWPNGGPLKLAEKRTLPEKMKSRAEASITLATLVPDLAGSVVGRANAQEAARKLFATLNNERLNTHLVHTVIDEVVMILFGVNCR
ncbi:Intermediate filament protein [Ascosphaera acerosa]|nr:Intermediate filament protein [Ascosphaera acerosa]